jgi:hypothetical protein
MIPVLEAISNGVSVAPAATFVGQAGAGPHAFRGFASALSAAQGLSPDSQTAPAEASAGGGPIVENEKAATSLNARIPASGNATPKKLRRSSAAPNIVAPGLISATVIPVPSPPPAQGPLPNLTPPGPMAPGLAPPNVPTPSTMLPATVADAGTGTPQPGLQTAAQVAALNYSLSSQAEQSQTAGRLNPTASSDRITGALANPQTSSTPLFPSSGPATSSGNLPPFTTAAIGVAAEAGLAKVVTDSRWNGLGNGLTSTATTATTSTAEPLAPTAVTLQPEPAPEVVAAMSQWVQAVERPASAPVLLASAKPDGGPAAGTLSSSSNVPAPPASAPADLTTQAGQSSDPAALIPILLANANSDAMPLKGVPNSSAPNLQIGGADATPTPADAAVQTDVSTPAATGNTISEFINRQTSAAPVMNPPGQLAPGKAALQFVAQAVPDAGAAPSLRGAARGTGTPLSPASSTPNSNPKLAMADKTPFSVFFSAPGPGTESAASTLPKMILPGAAASALRDVHGGTTETTSANPQTAGLQNGISHSAASPPDTKNSPAKTAGGAAPSGQASRQDENLSVANVQLVAAQGATEPTTAPAAAAAVVLPVNGAAALVADSAPKPGALPGSAPGGANVAPPLPETPLAAVTGAVQVAQLLNRMEQSEMRIGMNTSAFGSVEVRALVHANDVGLVVGSEKGDLRALLANDMSAIANTLQEQNLRLHSVNFMQGFAFSNNASGGGDSQPRSFVPMRAVAHAGLSAAADDSREAVARVEFARSGGSLSVLA